MEKTNILNPILTLILPVYNTEKTIKQEIENIAQEATFILNDMLKTNRLELLIIENGSTDNTFNLALELAKKYPYIKVMHLEKPSYGKALKTGLTSAGGDYLAILNIHFHNLFFVKEALSLFQKDPDLAIIVASKTLKESKDERPLIRRLITKAFNFFLKVFFNYKGTDTHGMKVLKKNFINPLIPLCITEGELFDTELLLLAQSYNLKIKELPTVIKTISGRSILKRILPVLKDLVKIYINIKKVNRKYKQYKNAKR